VEGQIQWQRRFELMQQHTGEHILSGLIHDAYGFHNTGFHVGADVLEVDFDGVIGWDALMELEAKANRAIWQDIPLKCRIPEPEELKTLHYRTKRELPWPVRIVQVPGYDSCACCGIHVTRTGQVGLIKILSATRLRGGIRLQMVCGERAYRHMARIFEENRAVSQAFSAPMEGTGAAAQKMNEALAAEKSRSITLMNRIFDEIAKSYAGQTDVLHFEDGLQSGQVRILADKIAGVITGRCAVFSQGNYCLATRDGDLRQLNRDMTQALQGRGGGKPNFLQGSVNATQAQIQAFFENL
jgi:alanyl-tRNA synthetase